jgi:hypothetical protein
MRKLFMGLLIAAIAFTSCTKDRVDEPRQKPEYKTYYFQVVALEKSGHTYSSSVSAVRVEIKK